MAGFGVAMLSSAIPYSLELEALRRVPQGTFGVLMSLEPAVAATVGFVGLGQDLAASEVVAIVLVVIASAGALRSAPPPAPARRLRPLSGSRPRTPRRPTGRPG